MRSSTVVIGALALTSGCNWVFGLDPVRLTDATIVDAVPDANLPTVKLSAITPMLNVDGEPTQQAAFTTISPPPTVQYGHRGEALIDTTIVGDDVWVGYDLAESPDIWRLAYTLAGGVPHEVHWRPSESMRPGRAVALQLTASDRDPVPATGTFILDSTGAPSVWQQPRAYTTNTWTIDPSPPPDGTVPTIINSNYAGMFTTAIAGEKRKPDPVKDWEVLLEYDDSASLSRCTVAHGTAAFHIDLAVGTAAVKPPFSINVKPGNYTLSGDGTETIINLLGANGLSGGSDVKRYQVVTFGPAGAIPLHHQIEPGIPLPVPVGILLAKCVEAPDTLPGFAFPSDIGLATVGTVMYATKDLPIDGGAFVRNGIEQSIVGDMGPFTVNFTRCAFAVSPTIDTVSVNITNATAVAIPAGGTTASLNFDASVANPVIDMYEATLYRVSGASLVPIREFTFTEKPLVFDRDQGQPAGTRYVFAIRVIRGASGNAANGDFRVWGNTQTLGVTHTQAFTLD